MFDQTIPSVALARLIKDQLPGLPIVLGGYALEGPPAKCVANAFPWIDAIVQGDGEKTIVDITRQVLAGQKLRLQNDSPSIIRGRQIDVDESPTPDYEDWFSDISNIAENLHVTINTTGLPVESSRGCWWGQAMHCVFCGIDDDSMRYRQKRPQTTLAMLREMRRRYGDYIFRFSDYIMPKAYYSDLLPQLACEEPRFRLHSEIKANHPPKRVRLLAEAGFAELQPGIESFSTPVLRAMDKGVRGIDNVSLLKAGYLHRITIYYNILFGLPTDVVNDYVAMIQVMPKLYHLIPPVSRNEIVVTRFAPLHSTPGRFGIHQLPRHHPSYETIFSSAFYDQTGFSLDDYAYYFERNFSYSEELEQLYQQIAIQVDHWKALHQSRFVELSYVKRGNAIVFRDSRFSPSDEYEIGSSAAGLYMACDGSPARLTAIASNMSEEEREKALLELEDRRIVWREGDWIFGLAVPKGVCDAHRVSGWPQSWQSIYLN
jgi:ribosomal peptide maturation radical SAM protein 1